MFLAWVGKLVGVMVSSLYLEIPLRDAVSLSLFMNSKGIVEVITFNFFLTNKVNFNLPNGGKIFESIMEPCMRVDECEVWFRCSSSARTRSAS